MRRRMLGSRGKCASDFSRTQMRSCIREWCAGSACSTHFNFYLYYYRFESTPHPPGDHRKTTKYGRLLRRSNGEWDLTSSMKYADAGVDIATADAAKQRIRHHASRTFTKGVLGGIGGFGALFALDKSKYADPVLVSSADGVGTKLKVAMATGVHSTVGGDLVNHCVNDILVQGAEPLFFLDYLAMGKLDPNVVEQLVE